MAKPTHGLPFGPVLLAVAALVAAGVSITLSAGPSGRTDQRVTADETVHVRATRAARSTPTYERVAGHATTLAPAGDASGEDVGASSALCPPGTRVVSGGYQTMTGGGETFYSDALTDGRVGWAVGAVNNLPTPGTVQAVAYCAREGRTSAGDRGAALAQRRSTARRKMRALVNQYRAQRSTQF